jgi:hypothetical protein
MALTKAQHAARKRYEWNVTEPDVHISSNTAWIAYVNKGSITDASGTMDPSSSCTAPRSHAANREPWQMTSPREATVFRSVSQSA